MKTKKFIEKVEALGYELEFYNEFIEIIKDSVDVYATIEINSEFGMDTDYRDFKLLSYNDKEALFDIIYEYTRTPLEEREEEKKYVYKIEYAGTIGVSRMLHIARLNYDNATVLLDGSSEYFVKQNRYFHFTDKEVEKYTGKNRALFDACEKIEVK